MSGVLELLAALLTVSLYAVGLYALILRRSRHGAPIRAENVRAKNTEKRR